jgi:hypothetical protein
MQLCQADFDAVLTPFLFDNFTEAYIKNVFNKIDSVVKAWRALAQLRFSVTGKWWQTFLLKSMFIIFQDD